MVDSSTTEVVMLPTLSSRLHLLRLRPHHQAARLALLRPRPRPQAACLARLAPSPPRLFLHMVSQLVSRRPTELQTALVTEGKIYREWNHLQQTPYLTLRRCDCPPALDTFVTALQVQVGDGMPFPTSESLRQIWSTQTHHCDRQFGGGPTHQA